MEDNTEQNKNNIIYELDDDDGNDGEYNIHNEDNIVNSNNIPTERDIKRLDELTEKDVFEMTFDSEENEERFYNSYAKVKGFSIRRDQLYKDKNNMVISRSWVCSKEGYRQSKYLEVKERKREPKQLTRVGCRACFRIKYNRSTSKYEVNEFFKEHNHSMIGPLGVQFLRSHRNVTSADKAQGNAMHHIGMRTSHIMDFAAQQASGYENVGFIQKDMYNHFGTERRAQVVDGDAEGALAYLCGKEEQDPMFYYKYDVDEENRLNNLFWTDGGPQTDYLYFGDVLMFDTTYRTNAYNKPFVILQGVSNHFQTTVFGCALLASEIVETYIWVLEKFLDVMDHKMPLSVITDGDKAMCRAIKTVMPTARHRLCKWHLKMNALSNIHIEGFLHSFEKCMSMQCTQEMFELEWKNLVDKYGLHNNKWIADVYCKRTLWAEAYLHGHFFAGAKSTQRCESLNAFFNRFLKVRLRLFEFVRAYDRALARLRHNEAKAQSETENTTPILSTGMKRIERHATDIFTRAIFFKFREQIKSEQVLFMSGKTDIEDIHVYYLSMYTHPESTWNVQYRPSDHAMKCSCLYFESCGIPCSHMVSIMKIEHLKEIPSSCILQRWTKNVKSSTLLGKTPFPEWVTQTTRFGALSSACTEMCYYASHLTNGYEEARDVVTKLTCRMKDLYVQHVEGNGTKGKTNVEGICLHFGVGVGDPPFTKTKGSRSVANDKFSKPRKCGHCRGTSHTRNKCPKLENENIDSFPTQDTYVSGASMLHQEGGFNVDLTFTNSDYNIMGYGSNGHPTFVGTDYNIMGCDSNIYPNFVVRTCSETPDSIYGRVVGGTIDLSK